MASISSCAIFTPAPRKPEPYTTPSGLTITDIKVPAGEPVVAGDLVGLHYLVALDDGTQVDSSRDRGTLFRFTLGDGTVAVGIDEGVTGMTLGGIRLLTVPPRLGYGEAATSSSPLAGQILHFEIELMEINP